MGCALVIFAFMVLYLLGAPWWFYVVLMFAYLMLEDAYSQ